MKCWIIALAALALTACGATPYKPHGIDGGYADRQIDGNTYHVSFEARGGVSDRATVETYLLYRAAELTQQRGFDWFVLGSRSGDTDVDPKWGVVGMTSTAMVRMFRGKKPENMENAYAAADILATVGPTIKR
jgi:hypothetical protein